MHVRGVFGNRANEAHKAQVTELRVENARRHSIYKKSKKNKLPI